MMRNPNYLQYRDENMLWMVNRHLALAGREAWHHYLRSTYRYIQPKTFPYGMGTPVDALTFWGTDLPVTRLELKQVRDEFNQANAPLNDRMFYNRDTDRPELIPNPGEPL